MGQRVYSPRLSSEVNVCLPQISASPILATVHYTQTVSNYFTWYPYQYYCYSYNIMFTASLVKASSPFYSHYKWEELLLMCSLKDHSQRLIGQKFHLELWPKVLYSIIIFLPGLIMHGFRKFQLWMLTWHDISSLNRLLWLQLDLFLALPTQVWVTSGFENLKFSKGVKMKPRPQSFKCCEYLCYTVEKRIWFSILSPVKGMGGY